METLDPHKTLNMFMSQSVFLILVKSFTYINILKCNILNMANYSLIILIITKYFNINTFMSNIKTITLHVFGKKNLLIHPVS